MKCNKSKNRSQVARYLISLILCSMTPGVIVIWYFFLIEIIKYQSSMPFFKIIGMFFWIFTFASLHAIFLGMPIHFLISKFYTFTYKIAALSGLFVGALPFAIFSWPLWHSGKGYSSYSNGVDMVIDGVPTAAGWLSYFEATAALGLLGLSAALVYKFCITKLQPL